ncbi:MAG: GDSL-type esterase/lipase family protein [Lachnospiraceae bacterium]|nr:GDSL-type esterase/lipase family protein [Lachnospiraceae bacterium]
MNKTRLNIADDKDIREGTPMNLLFLGDSITDSDHCFTPDNLGNGYVKMISDSLKDLIPQPHIVNRGTDGFTVSDVYRAWQRYPMKEAADMVSILVGINDAGVWMNCGYSGLQCRHALQEFTAVYTDLVCDILDYGIPRLILMEPFLFPIPERYKLWQPTLNRISQGISDIAARYSLPFLPLQPLFDAEGAKAGYDTLTTDGIHLTQRGNRILADAWIKAIPDIWANRVNNRM